MDNVIVPSHDKGFCEIIGGTIQLCGSTIKPEVIVSTCKIRRKDDHQGSEGICSARHPRDVRVSNDDQAREGQWKYTDDVRAEGLRLLISTIN